jgi:hypothetical protein
MDRCTLENLDALPVKKGNRAKVIEGIHFRGSSG